MLLVFVVRAYNDIDIIRGTLDTAGVDVIMQQLIKYVTKRPKETMK